MKVIELGVHSARGSEFKLIYNESESQIELSWFNGIEWEIIDSMTGSYLCSRMIEELNWDMHEDEKVEERAVEDMS